MAHPCGYALVVDDDPAVLEVIGDALRDGGVEVALARGAREAILALDRGFTPSVILVDLVMPGMGGERLFQELRSHPAARGVPMVAMSASPRLLERVGEEASARLSKPFDLGTLYKTLDDVCGRSSGER